MASADSFSSSATTPAPAVVLSPSTMAPTTPFYSPIQLTQNVVARAVGLTTSREVWVHLAQLFSSASEARLNQLRRELQTIRNGSLTMQDYFLKAKKLSDALAASGKPVSNSELQSMLLSRLDTAYDAIVTTLTATLVEIPLADFQAHLLAFEMRLHHQSTAPASTTIVNMAAVHDSSSPSPSRPQQQRGSFKGNRFNRKGNQRSSPPFVHPQGPCQLCVVTLMLRTILLSRPK
ncbi:hypothetical protein BVC80_1025g3 [Macleaya cordata]|uniref:Retrotransposon gag domain-containing protein n=1 Tax=Macleaya cordata TaxID=56857 RepID=A0A200QQR5_MACCD|nr:hypothetical protein BVC80_1025g3 [Macleaya cordata]